MFSTSLSYLSKILGLILSKKILSTLLIGSVIANSFIIILLGESCHNIQEVYIIIFCISLLSIFFDVIFRFIIYFFKPIFMRYINKHQKLKSIMIFSRKYEIIALILYRFIPFSRWPILITSVLNVNFITFLIFNSLGAFVWSSVCIYIGYIKILSSIIKKIMYFIK